MYGWRARIGLITPSVNTVSESEWNRVLPDGISVHAARMRLAGEAVADELAEMNEYAERCADLLATADVDVVVYGVTAGSYLKGRGYDEELEDALGDVAGVPAVATAASMRRAFDELGVERVAIATPYVEELDRLEVEFLEDHGYEVVAIDGLGIADGVELGAPTPESVYRQAAAIDDPDADAVFVSGMNYRTLGAIESLEADLGKPVLSSNQVTIWNALRAADVEHADVEFGSLFDHR